MPACLFMCVRTSSRIGMVARHDRATFVLVCNAQGSAKVYRHENIYRNVQDCEKLYSHGISIA